MIFFKLDIKNPIFYSDRLKYIRHTTLINHDLQLEIDCIEWALKKIEVNKIPMDRLEGVIRGMIEELRKKRQNHDKIRHR